MPQDSFYFMLFLYFRKVLKEIFSKWAENPRRLVLPGTKTKTKGDLEGCPGVPRGVPGMGPPWAMPVGSLEAPGTSSHRLFAYKLPLTLKSSGTEIFSTKQIGRAHV